MGSRAIRKFFWELCLPLLACAGAVEAPLRSFWDNVLSGMLSFQLMLMLLCGRALEINQLRRIQQQGEGGPYERDLFSALVVLFSILIICVAVCIIVVTIPCVRRLAVRLWNRWCRRRKKKARKERPQLSPIKVGGGAGDNRGWRMNRLAQMTTNVVNMEMARRHENAGRTPAQP